MFLKNENEMNQTKNHKTFWETLRIRSELFNKINENTL